MYHGPERHLAMAQLRRASSVQRLLRFVREKLAAKTCRRRRRRQSQGDAAVFEQQGHLARWPQQLPSAARRPMCWDC